MLDSNKKIKVTLREVIVSSEEGKSFCDTFIYIPENVDEQKLGNLYIIGEIVNFSNSSSYLVNTLASKIKTEFYSNPKRSTMESLESGLHKANTALSDLAEQDSTDWIGNLNMTCSTYKNGELYISQAGKIRTILIRDNKLSDIGKNIASQSDSHPFKTFANIASGELEVGDLVLFATPGLFKVFSEEELIGIVSSQNIDDFAQTISDTADQNTAIKTMGVLIMKIEDDAPETLPHTHIEIETYNNFLKKQRETVAFIPEEDEVIEIEEKTKAKEEITPPVNETYENNVSENIEEKLSLEDIIFKYENSEKDSAPENNENIEEADIKSDLRMKRSSAEEQASDDFLSSLDEDEKSKLLIQFIKKLGSSLNKLFFSIISPLSLLFQKLVNFKNKEKTDEELYQKINLASGRKKMIITSFLLVAFLLAGGLIFKSYKRIEDERMTTYSNIILQAKEKINQAEIDLITDKDEARKTLLEAIILINQRDLSLNENNKYTELNNESITLLSDIRQKLDLIDLVIRIDNPKLAIDFGVVEHINNPNRLFRYNDEYYVFDLNNKVISDLDFSKKSSGDLKINASNEAELSAISTLISKTGEIVFLSENDNSVIYNIKNKRFSDTTMKLSGFEKEIKDIASYSNFVYTLNPAAKQIYKFTKTQSGFNEATKWLDENNALAYTNEKDNDNAISMAIDGSIYILKANGTIDKYRTGSKQQFKNEIPSEPISNISTIYTKPDMKYLYITDIQNKRIVLFDKSDGKLVKQFISDSFNNLQNIEVNQEEETIYVLNANSIFEIEIED
ncbi:hypothetical protein K0B03_01695 [Patescibacteria group bacterium]|nr:hypothetical protein [Patescibacteria group bacterium]